MSVKGTICFFNTAKPWGGGEKWHYEAALFMQQRGYRVLVITHPGSALHQKLAHSVRCLCIPVGNLSYLNPRKVLRLKSILRQNEVQTIILNLSSDLKLAGIAARLAGVRRIIYRRGSAIPIKNHILNRFYFGRILTDVLANSEATKRTILQHNPGLFPADKIQVIYNPIDIQAFLTKEYTRIYTPQKQELVLGNIGRMVPQKNQQFLIDLAVKLKSAGVPFVLLIAGTGPLETALKKTAQEKGVQEEIRFTGFLRNVKDLLMSCDVFVLSSLWEGFGYVLAEAALCKKPSVAFNISSNPELVLDQKTGFLTPVNDVEQCFEKIMILRNNPDWRLKLGEQGFQYVCENFADTKIKVQLSAYLSE